MLKDQYKHEEFLELEDNRGNITGKLRVSLHWIHSKKRFLKDILNIHMMAIEEEKQEKEQLEI